MVRSSVTEYQDRRLKVTETQFIEALVDEQVVQGDVMVLEAVMKGSVGEWLKTLEAVDTRTRGRLGASGDRWREVSRKGVSP